MIKTITEETREACGRCAGPGTVVEQATNLVDSSTAVCASYTCGACHGRGSIVTKTVTRFEEINGLAAAIGQAVRDELVKARVSLPPSATHTFTVGGKG